MSADLRGSSTDTTAAGDQPRPPDQPRGADQLPVPPVTDQAAGAAARRQKYVHLFEGASETSSRPGPSAPPGGEARRGPAPAADTGHPPAAVPPGGADRTKTHPYPEVPGSTPAGPDGRLAGQAQGHPARDGAVGETSGTGNDGMSGHEGDGPATGQETPVLPPGGDSGEAAGQGDATGPVEASGHDEPQDSAAEADAADALKRRIAELEAANADLQAKSVAKDAVIAEQHDAIEAKDAAIAERDTALAEEKATVASQWRKISELDYHIDDLTAENEGLKAERVTLDADKADQAVQDAEATPSNDSPVAEKAVLPVAPEARNSAREAGQDRGDAPPPDRADQVLTTDTAGTSDEEQASQDEGIDGRKAALPAQEEEQPAAGRGWRRLVPSNELAGFIGGGSAGLGITIANVTHLMSDGWSAAAVAAAGFAVSGVALVNKIWKKGSDGSQSQD